MTIAQVCTIAGSDSGGGAGIQADLKTFQERRVYGTSVIVASTAQNTLGVTDVAPLPLGHVEAQLEAVFSDFNLSAIKTGMLVDERYIDLVANFLKTYPKIPVVVDPVMIAKGGASLIAPEAVIKLQHKLLPLTTLVTPNLPEAERLTGIKITDYEAVLKAAQVLQNQGARNILIKGGHSLDEQVARDFLLLADGSQHWLSQPRIHTKNTHGTGCTLSACITAELGKGQSVLEAVHVGKLFISAAIAKDLKLGHGHGPTNHWAYRPVDGGGAE